MEKQQNNLLPQTEHYILAPSIGEHKIIKGKSYYVRSYFAGEKDFGKTMEQLAIKNAYKNVR